MGSDFNKANSSSQDGDYELKGRELVLADAIAEYLEQTSSGQQPEIETFVQQYPAVNLELKQALALLEVPRRAAEVQPDVEAAWKKFRSRVFTGATSTAPSLGGYVQQAVATNDRELAAAGLPSDTIEALKNDPTPVKELKHYQLQDYAAFARRYGVKDSAFPKMLKWLKNVARAFSAPASPGIQGMAFARPQERHQGLTEAELAEALEQEQEKKTASGEIAGEQAEKPEE